MDAMWVTTLAEIATHAENACTETFFHTIFEVPTFPDVRIRRIPQAPITERGLEVSANPRDAEINPRRIA